MQLKFIIPVVLILAATAQAQQPFSQEKADQREQAVLNEDGGRSYLVIPAASPIVGISKLRKTSLGNLEQHSIFVGSGWAGKSLHARETNLSNLLLNVQDNPQLEEILAAGIPVYAPTWTVEKLDVEGNRTISDLEIQKILNQVIGDGPTPSADSLFIVYLDPTFHSKLGALVADKHYVAYHGFFNTSDARIHYAVVPFQSSSRAAYQIALRTFIVAALHTDETTH
jgi:hypothetical protein